MSDAKSADVSSAAMALEQDFLIEVGPGGNWQAILSQSVHDADLQAELLDSVALNLHRIDKDVQRCDRNYWYFTPANLDKLRNVMCTSVYNLNLA